jgi:uncharacterized protein
MIAREAGLAGPGRGDSGRPCGGSGGLAGGFLSEGFADAKAALEGARDILAEGLSEDAALLGRLRDHMRKVAGWRRRWCRARNRRGPSSRLLRPFRRLGHRARPPRAGDAARPQRRGPDAGSGDRRRGCARRKPGGTRLRRCAGGGGQGAGDRWLREAAAWAWRVKLKHLADARPDGGTARGAEAEAIRVFARNLKDLLLAAPAGGARRPWALTPASAPA